MTKYLHGRKFVLMGACLPDFRFGALLPQEGERWTVTFGGYTDDQAPVDDAGFLEFARSLQKPEIFNVIQDAAPLTPLAAYRFVSNTRRHYEKLARFPEGYLVYGDALVQASIQLYGQGMTVACVQFLCRPCVECSRKRNTGNRSPFLSDGQSADRHPVANRRGEARFCPPLALGGPRARALLNWYIANFYWPSPRRRAGEQVLGGSQPHATANRAAKSGPMR